MPLTSGRQVTSGERGRGSRDRLVARNESARHAVSHSMSLPILILFALGTTLPCVGLWLADLRDR
jgi:hypothetical protein